MPKIQWQKLPPAVLSHFVERVKDRAISAADLQKLDDWKRTEPEGPDGPWYKDFGSFKLCGNGALPLTFLTRTQKAMAQSCNQSIELHARGGRPTRAIPVHWSPNSDIPSAPITPGPGPIGS